MINKITKLIKPEPYEVDEEVSITCDACKKVYSVSDTFEIQEFFNIHHLGGYSSVFGDGNVVRIQICQHCMKKFIEEKCGSIENFIEEEIF